MKQKINTLIFDCFGVICKPPISDKAKVIKYYVRNNNIVSKYLELSIAAHLINDVEVTKQVEWYIDTDYLIVPRLNKELLEKFKDDTFDIKNITGTYVQNAALIAMEAVTLKIRRKIILKLFEFDVVNAMDNVYTMLTNRKFKNEIYIEEARSLIL